ARCGAGSRRMRRSRLHPLCKEKRTPCFSEEKQGVPGFNQALTSGSETSRSGGRGSRVQRQARHPGSTYASSRKGSGEIFCTSVAPFCSRCTEKEASPCFSPVPSALVNASLAVQSRRSASAWAYFGK